MVEWPEDVAMHQVEDVDGLTTAGGDVARASMRKYRRSRIFRGRQFEVRGMDGFQIE